MTAHALFRTLWICLALCLLAPAGLAQRSLVDFLALDGQIEPDGGSVTLTWTDATPGKKRKADASGASVISRRVLGETGAASWRVIAPADGRRRFFRDTTTEAGVAYEYRVHLEDPRTGEMTAAGYWATGVQVPPERRRGRVILVVDETIAADIAPRIDRFVRDLAGDGWQVHRLAAPRDDGTDAVANLKAARALKAGIEEIYWADRFSPHALILLGHVPVVMSGLAAPDGHDPKPHPTDLFYADMEGSWADDGKGWLRHSYLPAGRIDMMVGRIDFANLSEKDPALERRLLAAYLDRNHAWRHGYLGDPRAAYGQSNHLAGERAALDNIVGPQAVVAGGHHDAGERRVWLVGVDFGDGAGRKYRTEYEIKTVFGINFGSGKQFFNRRFNQMTGLLSQPWYSLATGWGGRPTWRLHHMAMGLPMGYSHLRTVNNGLPWQALAESVEYRPTGLYQFRNGVWINLLGDPTVRPFPVPSVKSLAAAREDGQVRLSWKTPERQQVAAWHVYRAAEPEGPFEPIGTVAGEAAAFTDPAPLPGGWYMVRGESLVEVYAGSFFTLSQGQVAAPGKAAPVAAEIVLEAIAGDTLLLTEERLAASTPGAIAAPIRPPKNASLTEVLDGWRLSVPAGADEIVFPYMISTSAGDDTGRVVVRVNSPPDSAGAGQ